MTCGDDLILHGPTATRHREHARVKLGQFVETEHAAMGQPDLARPQPPSARQPRARSHAAAPGRAGRKWRSGKPGGSGPAEVPPTTAGEGQPRWVIGEAEQLAGKTARAVR